MRQRGARDARRLYEAGVTCTASQRSAVRRRWDVVAIQQNLGHADLATTLTYIGELDADRRKPPTVYDFDLGALDAVAL